ncbi:tyrosine-type recombinase/integrase [[Ruminococcus] torques]|jgi:integrase|uniref:tyrosine-type recombinase/integrase n=1 Tax=[Ruminococcus] torques TaxID=33039 RepID=UPI00204973CA|nr:tyrosine-type recombinase/integrase [[Ruminococcus] torques]DAI78982.1 MAG TPA: Integrase [Bacteriophage sp.]
MTLLKCPECRHDVSDKALTCPNCGYPMNMPSSTKPRIRNGKPTKLPNGYGTIYKMSGKRSRPYRAMKTDKWIIDPVTGKSKQIRSTIGYYQSREDAMIALANYNENPYDIKADSITFSEVYEKWSENYFPTLSNPSSVRTVTAAYAYCNGLYDMRMKDIKVSHLEGTILNAQVGDSTKSRIKSLFNMMYKYAVAHDIVEKDYASVMFANGNPIKRSRTKEVIPFSQEEIFLLWDNLDSIAFADMILIGIYSGWRPQELAILKVADIDIKVGTMLGGLKTDAGKNRIVPIHPLIRPLIENRMKEATSMQSEFLFNDANGQQGTYMTYDKYRKRFEKVMKYLKLTHRPHETRHTFITKAKACNVDEYILKLIVGHAIDDITEKVYTHRTIDQLRAEMEKITK